MPLCNSRKRQSLLRSYTLLRQAVWACRGGDLGDSGGDGDGGQQHVAESMSKSEADVSSTSLEQTVRIPLERWPDSLLLTATGIRKESLAVDLLAKVRLLEEERGARI